MSEVDIKEHKGKVFIANGKVDMRGFIWVNDKAFSRMPKEWENSEVMIIIVKVGDDNDAHSKDVE